MPLPQRQTLLGGQPSPQLPLDDEDDDEEDEDEEDEDEDVEDEDDEEDDVAPPLPPRPSGPVTTLPAHAERPSTESRRSIESARFMGRSTSIGQRPDRRWESPPEIRCPALAGIVDRGDSSRGRSSIR